MSRGFRVKEFLEYYARPCRFLQFGGTFCHSAADGSDGQAEFLGDFPVFLPFEIEQGEGLLAGWIQFGEQLIDLIKHFISVQMAV